MGMLETPTEVFPMAQYQMHMHFYRNIISVMPNNKIRGVIGMPIAVHAQEGRESAQEKKLR